MAKRFFPAFIPVMALALAAVSGCAGQEAAQTSTPDRFAYFRPAALPQPTTFSGSYLAGRFAQRQQDWSAAQNYLSQVLSYDSDNAHLRQRTFLLSLGAGNYNQARALATQIMNDQDKASDLALVFLACDALADGDYDAAMTYLSKTPSRGAGRYTKPLLTAWTHAGAGDTDAALELLAEFADAADPTYNIHAGMIEELRGNPDAAAKHYRTAMEGGLTLHSAVMVGGFFARHGQQRVAETIFKGLSDLYPYNPFIAAMQDGSQADKSRNHILTAQDGAGFAIFDLATMLYEKQAYDSAQIYGSIVQRLVPESPFAMLMMGDIAAIHKNYPLAVEKYRSVSLSSPIYWLSRMRIAEIYEASGHLDLAIEALSDLTRYTPTRINALVSIGDIQRRHENFAAAVDAYDTALAELGALTEEHWPIIYARGIALERMNNWAQAEKDLLKALEYQPDNPMILNFIGYSWADKGVHLDKAMDYIRRAVAQRPDDGYILDSYGWAFYRMGRYDEAVLWLERAVEMVPDDATILDHLGDAYWQTGRQNEARFKWRRANELAVDQAFRTIIEGKLRNGVPQPAFQVVQKEAKL